MRWAFDRYGFGAILELNAEVESADVGDSFQLFVLCPTYGQATPRLSV
jgi:hypothetical protein